MPSRRSPWPWPGCRRLAEAGPGPAGRRPARGSVGARARRRALILGLVLLALDPGAARVLDDAWADEAPVAGTPPPAPARLPTAEQLARPRETPATPTTEVEALTERMRGIEGKLRESAVARKASDQARMEAERRLAEGTQESARLSAELGQLRDAKAELETRLTRAAEQHADTTAQLAATAEQVHSLTTETLAQTRRGEDLERRLAELTDEQRHREADYEAHLRAAEQTQAAQRERLREQEEGLARLTAELAAVTSERDARDARIATLSALVPAPAGGALTLETAQARAATAAAALREALTRTEGGDAQAKRSVREAEQRLHRAQFTVAQVAGAHSVYRVRQADTLVLIASHFYGDGSRWRAIRDANREVLPDPDRLMPGLTLVIP